MPDTDTPKPINIRDVRFDDFIRQLETVKHALTETDRITSNSTSVYFKVVDLRHQSPAAVVIEAVGLAVDSDPVMVVDRFYDSLGLIERQIIPEGFDYEALQAFRKMTNLLAKRRLSEITVARNGDRKSLVALAHNVDQIVGPDAYETGSITGMLEQINVHANQNVFTVYPTLPGQPRLKCVFPTDLRAQAVKAVDHHVRVTGRMKFKPLLKGARPYEMVADDIEVYPPDEELPRLSDLKGSLPSMPGDQASEDFIRGIRNGW